MIEGFVRLLRERNIRVGLAETIDACKAFSLLEIDKEIMREGLAACLIKDQTDRPDFDYIYDLYFCNQIQESKKSPHQTPSWKKESEPFKVTKRKRETERPHQKETQKPHTTQQDKQKQQQGILSRYGGIGEIGKAIDENDLEGAADQLLERILNETQDPEAFSQTLRNLIDYMKLYSGWALEDTANFIDYLERIEEVQKIAQRKYLEIFREQYPLEDLIAKLVKLDYQRIEELDFNRYIGNLVFLVSNIDKI
ncbi:MAG: hypothetical protein QW279_10005, partial [Candidatus Jordarchaeaceae archaeon]